MYIKKERTVFGATLMISYIYERGRDGETDKRKNDLGNLAIGNSTIGNLIVEKEEESMEQEEMKLKVPCGYQIKEKTKTIDLYEAYELLNTKRQHHYTKAERFDDQAILFWHTLRCPHCGKETPAYPHYLYDNRHAAQRKPEATLSRWAMVQLSLFDNQNNVLHFQQPEYCDIEYTCPKCGNISCRSANEMDIVVGCDHSTVYIAREIRDIKDILELKWLSAIPLSVRFPVYERIVFDFDARATWIQLIAGNDIFCAVNLNDFAVSADLGILSTLIYQNHIVKRSLKNYFQRFWQSAIPFTVNEISLPKLILLTRFVDFPREFYDAVPFAENSNGVDDSFAPIAKELHNPICAVKMLAKSTLPHTKSVKRLFAEKPGLFFYIEECETLFHILGDVNLFCRVLNSKEAYQIVLMLHSYPGVENLYRDYCKIKSEKSLCMQLMNNLAKVNEQAIRYCALSSFGKRAEQVKWKENRRLFKQEDHPHFAYPDTNFSTPMHPTPKHIENCAVDRFYFKWLKTKNEYQEAGKQLDNCLEAWTCYDNPVVAVYKGRKIIAAIEVDGNCIQQAFRIHNSAIDKNSALYSAIQKWCDKYSLNYEQS